MYSEYPWFKEFTQAQYGTEADNPDFMDICAKVYSVYRVIHPEDAGLSFADYMAVYEYIYKKGSIPSSIPTAEDMMPDADGNSDNTSDEVATDEAATSTGEASDESVTAVDDAVDESVPAASVDASMTASADETADNETTTDEPEGKTVIAEAAENIDYATAPASFSENAFSIVFPQEILDLKTNDNHLVTTIYGWDGDYGPKAEINSRIHTWGPQDNPWLLSAYQASGMSETDFHTYMSKIYAAYRYYGNDYSSATLENFLEYVSKVFETGSLDPNSGGTVVVLNDDSHWPCRLYVLDRGNVDTPDCLLTFKRYEDYYISAGITMDVNPANTKGIGLFKAMDEAFIDMAENETDYPNNDSGDTWGFVKSGE